MMYFCSSVFTNVKGIGLEGGIECFYEKRRDDGEWSEVEWSEVQWSEFQVRENRVYTGGGSENFKWSVFRQNYLLIYLIIYILNYLLNYLYT